MQVVILCGGQGLRAYPLTASVPKPMLPIGGTPVLVHLMRLFAAQGHEDFVLAVGHHQEVIREHFEGDEGEWSIEIVDSGLDTDTGDRVHRCLPYLQDAFFVTYGDGLCDVDLDELLSFHRGHPGLVTVTGVPLPSQYGIVDADEAGRIHSFREKPVLRDHWINAGFMVMDRDVFRHWQGANLERDVLPRLAGEGLVYVYRHDGFFKSLDSQKDQQELEACSDSYVKKFVKKLEI